MASKTVPRSIKFNFFCVGLKHEKCFELLIAEYEKQIHNSYVWFLFIQKFYSQLVGSAFWYCSVAIWGLIKSALFKENGELQNGDHSVSDEGALTTGSIIDGLKVVVRENRAIQTLKMSREGGQQNKLILTS